MKKYWKIGELAKMTGLTIRTLRYYDQIQLFSPSEHTESGHRLYTKADLVDLQQILSLKQMGLSLDEIKEVMNDEEKKFSYNDHRNANKSFAKRHPNSTRFIK